MKERPILFAGESVRDILAGRKTQTRRLLNPQPTLEARDLLAHPDLVGHFAEHVFGACMAKMGRSAYGDVGDHLWVRETWLTWDEGCHGHDDEDDACTEHCDQTYVAYQATPRTGYRPRPDRARITYLDESSPLEDDRRLLGPWRSGRFMPRWASRLSRLLSDSSRNRHDALDDSRGNR